MDIFLELNNTSVNISKIKEICIEKSDAVRITFDDGSTDVYSTCGDASKTMERFERTILQIAPCSVPMYNVYKDDDGGYFHERVCCVALCADGEVRSLACGEYFDLAVEARNFVGCFDEKSLGEYPESISGEAAK